MYYDQSVSFQSFSNNIMKYLYEEEDVNFPKVFVHLIYLTLSNKIDKEKGQLLVHKLLLRFIHKNTHKNDIIGYIKPDIGDIES